MMGMHGEAWVNTRSRKPTCCSPSACASTIASPATCKTYAPQREEDPHRHRSRRDQQERHASTSALVGDLREVLDELLPRVAAERSREWLARIDELKGDSAVRDIQNLPDNGHLYAAHVINDLWRDHRRQRASSSPTSASTRCGRRSTTSTTTPRSLITSGGLGTMGFALPAAIGAKVARPDAEVWVVVGDGGFQMTMCELATIVQEKLDINIAIINNGYLGMVRQWQEFFYEKRYAATPLVEPGLREAGRGLRHRGVRGHRARARSMPAVQPARAATTAPSLIDFQVEQEDSVYPMVPAGADLHEMIRRPSPIVETAAD